MIIIDTIYGLANRIRSVVSGMILAEELGEQIMVSWTPQPRVCAAAHHQIYADSDPGVFAEQVVSFPCEEIWNLRWRWGVPTMFGMSPSYDDLRLPIIIPEDVLVTRAQTIRIQTPWNFKAPAMTRKDYFRRYSELLHQHFRPLDIGGEFLVPSTHGIHIRRGDKTTVIRERILGNASNPVRCEKAMLRILRNDQRSSFLLCSDDAELKQRLRDSLGHRVKLVENECPPRNSITGMRFAARELYALGQVGTLLGDGDSSFGPTAAQYNNIPYVNLAPSVRPITRHLFLRGYLLYRKIRAETTCFYRDFLPPR